MTINVNILASLRGSGDQVEINFGTAVLQKEEEQVPSAAQFLKTVTRQVLLAATLPPLVLYWLGSATNGIDDESFLAATFVREDLDEEGYIKPECTLLPLATKTSEIPKFKALDCELKGIPAEEQALTFSKYVAVVSLVQWVCNSRAPPLH